MEQYKVDFKKDEQLHKISSLIENNSFTAVYGKNEISILHDGEETFKTLFAALEEAKDFIHMQYYILEDGKLLDRLLDIFQRKAANGVDIRLIYDSFGSFGIRGRLKKKFQDIGVSIYPILPIRMGNLLFSINFRNHRKIVVVDGKVAFTGGVNISDKYIDGTTELGKWKDAHLRLTGPVVNSLHLIFLKDFFYASGQKDFDPTPFMLEPNLSGQTNAQVVAGGPDSEQAVIMQQYMAMVNGAKECIKIANPYFIPGEPFLEAIKIAAQSKVEVVLLVPEKTDSVAAKYAMYSQFENLLRVGARIFVRKDFSHSKILIVDNKIISVGSGNFDYRSFEHNYETNIIIYDTELSKELSNEFDALCEKSKELTFSRFKKRPRWKKFLEGLSKFFKPLL